MTTTEMPPPDSSNGSSNGSSIGTRKVTRASPTLIGWVVRDLVIGLSVVLLLWLAGGLQQLFSVWWTALPIAVICFIACYALCYIVHEWGHYLGARFSGIKMPLAPYRGFILGQFQIDDYTVKQYLWLSWGGDLGHVIVTVGALILYLVQPGWVSGAFLVGGIAFSVQALAVDQPIIWKVTNGADIVETATIGTAPQLILKRTWQTWLPLASLIVLWQWFS
ncbi:MAG: hypothetical protein ACI8Z1_004055 [Candidatus Azotimanducaceae bacterium]|jgi:hypothetical protein